MLYSIGNREGWWSAESLRAAAKGTKALAKPSTRKHARIAMRGLLHTSVRPSLAWSRLRSLVQMWTPRKTKLSHSKLHFLRSKRMKSCFIATLCTIFHSGTIES